jgi:hypothetical protein
VRYFEDFSAGDQGGWHGWGDIVDGGTAGNPGSGPVVLPLVGGALLSQGPWWLDYNHCPPGNGYLHLLYGLLTHPSQVPLYLILKFPCSSVVFMTKYVKLTGASQPVHRASRRPKPFLEPAAADRLTCS